MTSKLPRVEAKGFLFIGDPHIATVAPGRRRDPEFFKTVAGKLDQAFAKANQLGLQPVITGDLFHKERDSSPELLSVLFRTLRQSVRVPWCLVGNHDLEEAKITDRVALAAVAETGLLDLIGNGVLREILCGDTLVGMGGTPYGQAVPATVQGLFSEIPDSVIWLTHADIRFKQAYPGALEPFEIEGCNLVVNGHMHIEQPSVQAGDTLWVNPGNITRVSVDALDYAPGVLAWTPLGGLRRYPLVVAPGTEVFNLQGRLTQAQPWCFSTGETQAEPSSFVRMLTEDTQNKTGSGKSVLAAEMIAVASEEKIPPAVTKYLLELLGTEDEGVNALGVPAAILPEQLSPFPVEA